MEKFPENISVSNVDLFSDLNFSRLLALLRKNIYEHLLWNDDNNFFDLDKFCKENLKRDTDMLEKMIDIIIGELNKFGWNCKLSYGGTALFIYRTTEPPPSCW
jgi:hypothetical protein